MLEHERIDISKGIDVNKTNLSKECNICHYWYFKNFGFKYELYLCDGCHDLIHKAMGFNNIAIVYIKENAYRIHFWYMSKDDSINIMAGFNLVHKRGVLYIKKLLYIKMGECNSIEYVDLTYYQKNRDVILYRAKGYYENDKEILREQVRDKYRNLSEEEKIKKENMEKKDITICLKKRKKD